MFLNILERSGYYIAAASNNAIPSTVQYRYRQEEVNINDRSIFVSTTSEKKSSATYLRYSRNQRCKYGNDLPGLHGI